MFDFWDYLFDSSGFPPRWRCGSWSSSLGWMHILSDVAIWSAYFVIPCILGYFAIHRKNLPFRNTLLLFVAFILLCGLTHLMNAVLFWWPAYRLDGLLKWLTAVVSWATVLTLFRVTPQLMALRNPAELEKEIAERQRVEEELRALQASLERLVAERTWALRESEERFRSAFDNAPIGMALVAPNGRFLRVNEALCRLVGYSSQELLDTDFQTISHPEDLDNDLRYAEELFEGRATPYHLEKRYTHKAGPVIHTVLSVSLVRDRDNVPLYSIKQIQDITERKDSEERVKASLREKETLLKEIHHRVKNNLQIVSSLLDLQCRHTKDTAAIEMFRESRGRVRSMALIHERLYRSQDMARVDFAKYCRQLTQDLFSTYRVLSNVRLELEVDIPSLPIDLAIPCGLLLNELISNCLKHAFPPLRKGTLRVSLRGTGGANLLTVADDGVGFPADKDFFNATSFGLQLVNTLVDQLDGEIGMTVQNGTTITVRFPKNPT